MNYGLLVDGPLQALKPLTVSLPKPRQTGFSIGPSIPGGQTMYQSGLGAAFASESGDGITSEDRPHVSEAGEMPYVPGRRNYHNEGVLGPVPVSQASMSLPSQFSQFSQQDE